MVGPLPSAGENDGVATVFESAGWAAETEFENHAVVNSEDMSVLARFRQQRLSVSSPRSFLQHRQDVGSPLAGCF